jgi:3-phosphoshikimate 1-carboxyvinyltransferase
MARLTIAPSCLKGKIGIPPSKSHTMRALLFGSMARGKSVIHQTLNSPDTALMIAALRKMGAQIELKGKRVEIMGLDGELKPCEQIIDAGNSGQILRFIGSLAALLPTYTILTGDASISRSRPLQPLLSALSQLKAFAVSSRLDGGAPIIVRGPLQPGQAALDGEDSQPVSGLLMATAFLQGTTELRVQNPGEKPWVDLTLSWLKRLGGDLVHRNHEEYRIKGGLSYEGFEYHVPGDFSSAAFPLVAALLTRSQLTLENVDMGDLQGDKKIIDILREMGAQIECDERKKWVTVLKSEELKGTRIDVNDLIDAIPILAVVGCFASGTTEIKNGAIARKKESDRIFAIASELRKMGAQIEEREDGLLIEHSKLRGAALTSHADHRIAMALAVAALAAQGSSQIEGSECIAKSFPSFISAFQMIGANFDGSSCP